MSVFFNFNMHACGVTSFVYRRGSIVVKCNRRAGQALPDMGCVGKISGHPNIVVVLGYSRDGSIIAMSYAGECLHYDNKTPDTVTNIMAQVLNGLEFLQNKLQFIHMDIKPQNLLLNSRGVVTICDLGALMSDGVAFPVIPVGTPYFMTPDCARSDGFLGGVVPLWALGVCALIWLQVEDRLNIQEENCACLYRVGRLRSVNYQSLAVDPESVIFKYWSIVFALKEVGLYCSAACSTSTQQLRELVQPHHGLYSSPSAQGCA